MQWKDVPAQVTPAEIFTLREPLEIFYNIERAKFGPWFIFVWTVIQDFFFFNIFTELQEEGGGRQGRGEWL